MALLKLTKTTVEGQGLADRDQYVWDTDLSRFGVRITPAGNRIYLVQYRPKAAPGEARRLRRVIIGAHGRIGPDGRAWTAEKAREAATRLLAAVTLGGDPFRDNQDKLIARARAEKADAEAEAGRMAEVQARAHDSFDQVVARYVSRRLGANRSASEVARLLRRDPAQAWGERFIGDIRRIDVISLLDDIKQRSPATARLTYSALRGLFNWSLERELIDASPMDRVTAPPRPAPRDRVLTDDELRAVWSASDGLGYPFAQVVRLLILTGQREAEVGGMTWGELDLDAGVWRLPAARSKNRLAHEIDLSSQALAVLADVPRLGDHLFPARPAPGRKHAKGEGEKGVVGFSAAKRRLDALLKDQGETLAPWVLHDLRRTAASGMAALGIAPHVIEKTLNYVASAGALVRVYQRFDHRDQRKAALTAWGARVAVIAGGGADPSNIDAPRNRGAGMIDDPFDDQLIERLIEDATPTLLIRSKEPRGEVEKRRVQALGRLREMACAQAKAGRLNPRLAKLFEDAGRMIFLADDPEGALRRFLHGRARGRPTGSSDDGAAGFALVQRVRMRSGTLDAALTEIAEDDQTAAERSKGNETAKERIRKQYRRAPKDRSVRARLADFALAHKKPDGDI